VKHLLLIDPFCQLSYGATSPKLPRLQPGENWTAADDPAHRVFLDGNPVTSAIAAKTGRKGHVRALTLQPLPLAEGQKPRPNERVESTLLPVLLTGHVTLAPVPWWDR
jgi:hypothetical protein